MSGGCYKLHVSFYQCHSCQGVLRGRFGVILSLDFQHFIWFSQKLKCTRYCSAKECDSEADLRGDYSLIYGEVEAMSQELFHVIDIYS